jgi:hypothetical protein
MNKFIIAIAFLVTVLSGCLSHDGTYSPGCIAHAGSTITLTKNQFVWEKFTDEVVVDSNGEIVNQFPGYPLRGGYSIDGQTVHMESAAGEAMPPMYLHRHDSQQYLLTEDEFTALDNAGRPADCALRLNAKTASQSTLFAALSSLRDG